MTLLRRIVAGLLALAVLVLLVGWLMLRERSVVVEGRGLVQAASGSRPCGYARFSGSASRGTV